MEEAAAQMPQRQPDDDESSIRSMNSRSSSSSSSDAGATPTDLSVCSSSSSSSTSSVSEEEVHQNENVVDISHADPAVIDIASPSQPVAAAEYLADSTSEVVDATEDPPEDINSVETENEAELAAPSSPTGSQEQDELSNQDEASVDEPIEEDISEENLDVDIMPPTEPIQPETVAEADSSDDYQEGEIAEETENAEAELAANSFVQEQDELSHNDEIIVDEPIEEDISEENLDVDIMPPTEPIQPEAVAEVDSTEYEQEDEIAEDVESVEAELAANSFIQEQDELSHNDEIIVDEPIEEDISEENLDFDITPPTEPIQPESSNE
eukprot:scaffold421202_cov51-Attheya_sp.AAC.2